MKYISLNTNKITGKILLASLIALTIFTVFKPKQANAGFNFMRLIDPLCLTCDNDNTKTTIVTQVVPAPPVITKPVHYGGGTIPIYTYPTPTYPSTPTYPTNNYSQLYAYCYPIYSQGNVGTNMTWVVSSSGGNGNYYTTWC